MRTQIISEGPLQSAPVAPSYAPTYRRSDIPEHHKFLRGECAQMAEGIRTAQSRGVSSSVAQLHADYRKRCAEEESEAYSALNRERNDKRAEKREQQQAIASVQTEAKRNREGCVALGDTIAIRRKRVPQMNDAELAAFKQSESAFLERCR